MFCDFLNRGELARDHLPQDLLYVLTLYVEALNNAIRSARGTVSYIELDSVCALFGIDRGADQACAIRTAGSRRRSSGSSPTSTTGSGGSGTAR